ncbi:MAG: hypothetical protein JW940_06175 [Polyangiaceae bacterium]|nr:hypothetical protein [Polyangiaceae bacterium]
MTRRSACGIFCLEGDWSNDLAHSSTVKPILELLSQGGGGAVPYVHRGCGTLEELEHYLRKWAQTGLRRFPILYLAFHGIRGGICVGDQRRANGQVTLDRLAALLGDRLSGRLIHFGSCDTLRIDRRNIQRFLKLTNATAVTGYRKAIGWLPSAAFEVLLFDTMRQRSFTRAGLRAIQADLRREIPALLRDHDFRMEIRD